MIKTEHIYLDSAATTPVDNRAKKEMEAYFSEYFGNPGSTHDAGIHAKNAVEYSRIRVANVLHCTPEEIIFTSGGTESINLALQGISRALKNKGKHIITSKIEHPAVLNTCKYLEQEGYSVTYVDVDSQGIIDVQQLTKALRKDTILITIMYANNEIGTIQPIAQIAEIARQNNVYFHTDACQAAGMLDINVENSPVDLMTLNGSKIYGPKGAGVLYVRKEVNITPLLFGGGQEHGLRSGTENVPAITGFAKALELADAEKENETKRLTKLRDTLIKEILEKIPQAKLNGSVTKRLPNNVNISVPAIDGQTLVNLLNEQGICASTGSACTTQTIEPSHVLTALGETEEMAHGAVRFTIGRKTTKEHIDKVIKILPLLVAQLQSIQPTLELEPISTSERTK